MTVGSSASSHLGKFICVWLNYMVRMAGGETYLLEKTKNIFDYTLISMGKVKLDYIDDAELMQIMDEAFNIKGFTHDASLFSACSSLSLNSKE